MGQLIWGVAGMAIGFAIGGPLGSAAIGAQLGFLAGTLIGSLVDPPKSQGPRLEDTKVRGADYGTMRPIVYGTMRVGGLGCGQGSTVNGINKFTEHEQKSGGKGGPEVTNYKYTLSFFNEICEGPIAGVGRRWVNARLITGQDAEFTEDWPFVLYLGTNDQLPDPTMEIVYGVGEVNPMRGVALEAITEKDVTDVGNARPNVEYEVYNALGPVPRRIALFDAWNMALAGGAGYKAASYENGVITAGSNTGPFADTFWQSRWDVNGNQIGTTTSGVNSVSTGGAYHVVCGNCPTYQLWSPGGSIYKWHRIDYLYPHERLIDGADYINSPNSNAPGAGSASGSCIFMNGFIYSVASFGGSTVINKTNAPEGEPLVVPSAYGDASRTTPYCSLGDISSMSSYRLGNDTANNKLYVMRDHGTPGTLLWRLDPELFDLLGGATAIEKYWDVSETAGTHLRADGGFFVWNGLLPFQAQNTPTHVDGIWRIHVIKINSDDTLENWGSPILSPTNTNQRFTIQLRGCIGIDEAGTFSLCGGPASVTLASIVYDLCIRAGLTDEQIDVEDLTQEVRGFVVASQMTAHNAIDTLRRAFFFDCDDSDGLLKFVNRGHDSIATIPDEDLAAHEFGSEKPEPLEITRINEAELPRTVSLKYYDFDHDYQPGSVYWRRTATHSQTDTTIDLSVVFTADEALSICQWHMYFAWLERDRYVFFLTRKWVKLTKCDVVNVRGVDMRIVSRTESPNGLIRFEAVRAHAGPYAPSDGTIPGETPGAPSSGQPGSGEPGTGEPGTGGGPGGQTPPTEKAPTQLVLLDIPLASSYPFGFHAAMGRASTNSWPGAALYKSADGGVTYNVVASTFVPNTIAYVTSGVLATYGAGDTLDATVVTVLLSDPVGLTLESCTDAALEAGANACALRNASGFWELLQFRDANLVSTGVYELSNWLRGRHGSSTAGHALADYLVMLPAVQVDGLEAELNVERLYKAVTFGTSIADALPVAFTNTGLATDAFFGTAAGNLPVTPKPITGTTYTILSSDRGKLLTFGDPAGVAVTLPPGGVGFPSGWYVYVQNAGVGNVVITTSATIDGASSLTLTTNQGTMLASDGVNYTTMRGTSVVHVGDIVFDEDVDVNSHKIINLDDPTNPQDAATKAYTDAGDAASIAHADALVAGLDIKASCRAATISNIVLSGPQIIDGVSIIAGERVLVKDQSTAAENGIYDCAAGTWPRSSDANVSAEVTSGMFAFVTEGAVNGDKGFVLITNDPIVLATTPLVFTQFSATAPLAISGTGFAFVTSGTIDAAAKTATDATALLDAVVGDSGSGGLKGLAPAPAAGDAAAGKFLSAAGTYLIPSGVGASSAMIVIAPAYAATLTIDLATYATYPTVVVNVGVLTGPITFDIVNGFDGQVIRATFTQDGTGGREFTAGSSLSFSDDLPAIALTTDANKSDETAWRWHGASSKARATAINKGFA